MEEFLLQNIRQSENLIEKLERLKHKIEQKINLDDYPSEKPVNISGNFLQRLTFSAGLSISGKRKMDEIEEIPLSKNSVRIHETVFSKSNLQNLWVGLLKMRYRDNTKIDVENAALRSRIVNFEMLQGLELLLQEGKLEEWLNVSTNKSGGSYGEIPKLELDIGSYGDDIPAKLDLNSRDIPNTQIIIAGSTGSGKSNLLAVLMREMRSLTTETSYPLNFLFFDYKGEFSDPDNKAWLSHFEIDESSILDPISAPLPFNPFKDFTGEKQNAINLYATEMSNALCAIDNAKISANMNNRLSEAVIEAYKINKNKPINFQLILESYESLQSEKEQKKDDSITSILKNLIRNNLFEDTDALDVINSSLIINMREFPKGGSLAKAIVYFVISKLNSIYEKLPKQAVNDECVEIRHFTIIDEAHYMLDFDNKPLRDLIAVGRNKGLSIILATQNMSSYKTKHFDFFANAQYPLIMKQQSVKDSIIKDLFGVSGNEFREIKEVINGLSLGELVIQNREAVALGVGKKYKKMKVNHLI